MRKICILLVLLSLCLLMVACENQESTENTYSTITPGSDSASNTDKNDVTIDPFSLCFRSWDKYNMYLDTYEIADDFVRYEDLKMFGEFYSLIFKSDVLAGDYSRYYYEFRDSEGNIAISINIEPKDYNTYINKNVIPAELFDETDIRKLRESEKYTDTSGYYTDTTGYYTNGEFVYYYYLGELKRISWTVGEIRYSLHVWWHKLNTNTKEAELISKFYNKDTALEAVKEIFGNESVSCY